MHIPKILIYILLVGVIIAFAIRNTQHASQIKKENFTNPLNGLKSTYRRNKRKARMLKEVFTNKL